MNPTPTICALCLKRRVLCKSHIIPEFMYRPGYDEKGRIQQVNAQTGERPFIQKGYRERLLCDDCERFLNDYYEKPVNKAWYEKDLLGEIPAGLKMAKASGIRYAPFKLFHLSVLWRAAVATGGGFEVVRLGPHTEKIRKMILAGEPGEPHEYPLMATALTMEGQLAHGLTSSAAVWKHEGLRVYVMIYGGFEWGMGVGSHCPPIIRKTALTKEGTMLIPIKSWGESDLLRQSWEQHGRLRRSRRTRRSS